jgi:acylpyruvate hydrolase
MRLVTLRTAEGTRAGRVDGDEVVVLPHADVGALLSAGDDWRTLAAADGPRCALAAADLAPVVPRPSKIICLGLNYVSHITEMGHELPRHPTLFAKFARALIGARDAICMPGVSEQVDWEAELAFVIGVRARHVPADRALDSIAGWTVFNDVTVRDYQRRTSEFLSGKTFENTSPMGPALVTRDEASDDGLGLDIECSVDGTRVQHGNTADLLFTPADIVAYVSTIVTLDPGDIVATGTPAGVAAARTPPPWLRSGQVVRTAITGIGELVNQCRPEALTQA